MVKAFKKMALTIWRFFNPPISCGRYSKSLSAKYKALNVSAMSNTLDLDHSI